MLGLIIRGGQIIDGSGKPGYPSDVGISGDQIVTIGKFDGLSPAKTIEAKDRVVCPGFIDMHTHSDVMILANPRHEAKVMQGVTTDLLGLDGLSYAPLPKDNLKSVRQYIAGLDGNPDIAWGWNSVSDFLSRFDRKAAVNVAYLVPHIALRLGAMGWADRHATADELRRMQEIMAEGMEEGAAGFSTGLDYCPGRYSNTEELIEICRVVARYKGISVWHTRVQESGLIESIKEVLQVAEETGVAVHISHFAANGPANKGKSKEMLALIDEAQSKSIDITFDSYPYLASSTMTILFLPRWVHEGGPQAILKRLAEKTSRAKIRSEIGRAALDWNGIYLTSASTDKNQKYVGKNVLEAAATAGKEIPEFICDLLLEEELAVSHLRFIGNEEDVRVIMKHPCHMASSDGLLIGDRPNPRGWGTFPRYLGYYSRDLGILSLEETIRQMTSSPAWRLGLSDRGLIKEGFKADLVIFNPDTIADKATYAEPRQYPDGIDYVIINGEIVVAEGKHTGVLAGRALKRA